MSIDNETKEILEDSIYDIFRTYGLMSAHNNDNISNDDFLSKHSWIWSA